MSKEMPESGANYDYERDVDTIDESIKRSIEIFPKIADNIKSFRQSIGVKQIEVANASEIPASRYNRIERGEEGKYNRIFSLPELGRILHYLNFRARLKEHPRLTFYDLMGISMEGDYDDMEAKILYWKKRASKHHAEANQNYDDYRKEAEENKKKDKTIATLINILEASQKKSGEKKIAELIQELK